MRKLATALAVSIALSSGSARALSLGEIEMRSALNQPMSAEIRLSSVRAGELDGMIVKLASPEAFARAGIDRTDVLADLEFSVSEATQSIIITSRRPVVEPFLNFLLEVDWSSGRMVREYTVLLDPPVFLSPNTSERTDTAADSPAFVQRDDTSLVTPTPIQRDSVIPGDIISFDQDGGELVSLDAIDTDSIGVAAEERALATSDAARNATSSLIGGDVLDGGEVVSLDGLDLAAGDLGTTDSVVTFDNSSSVDGGELVSLTDLGAPNTDAQVTFDSSGIPEVQLFGGGGEAGEVVSSDVVTLDSTDGSVGSTAGGSVTVRQGDTLGVIAANAAGNGVSPQQMMMALLAANESAFINGNINLVKAGATLRIPSAGEATRLSQAEAVASVNDQSRLWQEYRDSTRSGQGATQVAQAPSASSAADSGADAAGLSNQAAAILERARTEVLRRDELNIVADNESTTTSASATSDESTESEGAVSEINRRIQLAREELASSVRETTDLDEQSDALRDTGENLDTLVNLQQNDIAKLEAQLEAAKSGGDSALDGAQDALSGAADGATDLVGGVADGAGDLVGGVTDGAGDLVGGVTDGAGDLVGGVADGASDTANNALSAAGEQLDSVELVGTDAADAAAGAASDASASAQNAAGESKGWLAGVMGSSLKWIPIALIGLFGIGLLGVLFKRKKRTKFDDDELDDVEFFDDSDSVDGVAPHASVDLGDGVDGVKGAASSGVSGISGAGAAAAAGVAGVAGTAAAAVGMGGNDDNVEQHTDETLGATAEAFAGDANLEELDHDDTISEVDVYLAYGLHGQAEELLTKAIDRDSDNAEYQAKLLETYAAQGNSEGYAETANQFQNKFGDSHPLWPGIAERGNELDPGNAMFAGSAAAVASVGVGRHDEATSMGDEDFASSMGDEEVSSINRDFGSAESLPSNGGDESHLMDQSIDPAFAFDEADLEATGDFSQIAGEIAADAGDDTSSLDFPSMDKASDTLGAAAGATSGAAGAAKGAALGAAGAAAAGAAGIAGTVGDKANNAMNDMSLDMPDGLDMPNLDATANLPNAAADLDLDSTSNLSSAADDLTLDLNQLSGDMELDSTELLDDSMSVPSNDETMLAGTDSLDSVDEMDTMMDLAKAYIDMGDNDSASSALDEIVKSGSPQQVSEAETLKRKIS